VMRKVYVTLAGGLGNQLFQLSAGLSLAGDRTIKVISCLGNPRGAKGRPDILDFKLSSQVELINCTKEHPLLRKVFNFLISMSTRRNFFNSNVLSRTLICGVSGILFSIHLRGLVLPKISNGVGYDPTFLGRHGNLLVGYFQTFHYLADPKTNQSMRDLCCESENSDFNALEKEIASTKILMTHVRLGDYETESVFGVLSPDYFKNAFESILTVGQGYEKIWVFSDSPEKALALIPREISIPVKVVPHSSLNPAQTLMLMRLCDGFVISNSSFSWWAAALATEQRVEVVAPEKWFIAADDPVDLLPLHWVRVPR